MASPGTSKGGTGKEDRRKKKKSKRKTLVKQEGNEKEGVFRFLKKTNRSNGNIS